MRNQWLFSNAVALKTLILYISLVLAFFSSNVIICNCQVFLNTSSLESETISLNSISDCFVVPEFKRAIIRSVLCSSSSNLLVNGKLVYSVNAQTNNVKGNIFLNSGDSVCISSSNLSSYCTINFQLFGNECFGDNQTAVPEIQANTVSNVSLQPSLVSSFVRIVQTSENHGDFFICDLRGSKVYIGYIDSKVKDLNLEFLVSGIYTFSFNNETVRFVKLE